MKRDYYQGYCASEEALRQLRNVRDSLKRAGCRQSYRAVCRAISSVYGARRHAALRHAVRP